MGTGNPKNIFPKLVLKATSINQGQIWYKSPKPTSVRISICSEVLGQQGGPVLRGGWQRKHPSHFDTEISYETYASFQEIKLKASSLLNYCSDNTLTLEGEAVPVAMVTLAFTKLHLCVHSQAQSRVRLCDPMDCGPPGSSVHGMLQARILEWVALSSFRGSISGIEPVFPALTGGIFTTEPRGKPPAVNYLYVI